MKFETFRKLRTVGFIAIPIVAIVLLFRACSGCGGGSDDYARVQQPRQQQQQNLPQSSATTRPNYGADELPLTSVEREIMQLQQDPLSSGKEDDNGSIKRILTKSSYKVDFRCDKNKGSSSWNRVKVDWNNNRKYDEKWNFREDGSVARFVAPTDDENYSIEYRLRGDKWVKK